MNCERADRYELEKEFWEEVEKTFCAREKREERNKEQILKDDQFSISNLYKQYFEIVEKENKRRDEIRKDPLNKFIEGLEILSKECGIYISGCGCCDSPTLETEKEYIAGNLTFRDGKYIYKKYKGE